MNNLNEQNYLPFSIFAETEKYDKSRVHALLRDYIDLNSFSLLEASFLWFDLKPDEVIFNSSPPKKILSIASVIFRKLPPIKKEENTTWRYFRYSHTDLKALAKGRGVKPPFLFEHVRCDFDNWQKLNNFHPDDTEELTKGGYKSIAIMANMIKEKNNCTITEAIALVAAEADEMKREDPDINIYGVGTTNLAKAINNGTDLLNK